MPALLAIDDDPAALGLIEAVTADMGLSFQGAASIAQARAVLDNLDKTGLMIVDGILPDGTGIDFLHEILPEHKHQRRVIFLSAYFRDFRIYQELRALGVDKVLHKPITPEALKNEIATLLEDSAGVNRTSQQSGRNLPEDLKELHKKYLDSLMTRAAELERLLNNAGEDKRDDIRFIVHKLAGTAGTFGLRDISELAYDLEKEMDRGTDLRLLGSRFQRLTALLKSPSEPSPKQTPSPTWRPGEQIGPVLLIDDDPHFGERLVTELQASGVVIKYAQNPVDAMAIIHSSRPGIIVLDYDMGSGEDGPKLAEQIREELGSSTPLVFLTLKEGLEERIRAGQAGSSLYLTKPITSSELLESLQRFIPPIWTGTSIMVVDDDEPSISLIKHLLEPLGINIASAQDANTFWRQMEESSPSLVILDVNLPVYSGFELCRVIKADPRFRDIPVVLVTARSGISDRVAAFQAGADDFIPKPLIPEEFIARVTSRLRKVEQAEAKALYDGLTGLPSRSGLENSLQRILHNLKRSGLGENQQPPGAILLDIDDFRQLNNMAGHGAGDQALQLVADAVRTCAHRSDVIGRWGDVQFTILFTSASVKEIEDRFQRLRTFLLAHPINLPSGQSLSLTVSAGATRFRSGDTPLEAMRRADASLYWAKERGKNRLEMDMASQPLPDESFEMHPAPEVFEGMVGRSNGMREVFRRIRLAAQSDVTVLLRGESGTGKELAARAIHELSKRRDRPFIALNCSALPETLLESELFGHVKGAFTGAIRNKTGVLEAAQGGTLFLDEIGDISPLIQLKLLRVLQEREIRPVGGDNVISVDVRVITATNKPLEDMLASGVFREDFYYRIRVFEIFLPPLRERREDINLIVRHFISELSRGRGKNVQGIAPTAMQRMLSYPWPGNVRELRNALEHAFVTVQGEQITLADLPQEIQAQAPVSRIGARFSTNNKPPTTDDLEERERIISALREAGGNRTEAARNLGISRVTLWKKIRRHAVDVRSILDAPTS